MYRIIYIAKNGKSYDVSFRGLTEADDWGERRQVRYEIKSNDSKFTYRFEIVKEGDKRLDDETMGRLLLRITFQKMQELLDEGKEEDCEDPISRKNFPGKWPPSLFDYPKICSFREENEQGLFFCEMFNKPISLEECENECKIPEDFERCKLLQRPNYCKLKPIKSLNECEDCPNRRPCVIKSQAPPERIGFRTPRT